MTNETKPKQESESKNVQLLKELRRTNETRPKQESESPQLSKINKASTATSMEKKDIKIGLFGVVVISLIISLVTNGLYWRFIDDMDSIQAQQIVVIDSAALATAKIQDNIDLILDPEAAIREAEYFHQDLGLILREYVDAGYIVLNKSVMSAYPDYYDITTAVAERMNVRLELSHEKTQSRN